MKKITINKTNKHVPARIIASLLTLILVLLLVTFPVLAKDVTASNIKAKDAVLYGPYAVERVVDGDTIIIDLDGERTRVRLKSIDTPESVHPNDDLNTESGVYVSDIVKELLEGTEVYLEYQPDDYTDTYGRTLAFVYLSDGQTMVNAYLLEEGYATFESQYPCKYKDDFEILQDKAIKSNKGLWRNGELTSSMDEPASKPVSAVAVICIVVAVIIILGVVFLLIKRKKKRS